MNFTQLVLKGLSIVVILIVIVTPLMLLVIVGLYYAFAPGSAIGDFISDHTTAFAFLVIFGIIAATFGIISLTDKFIKRKNS